MAAKQMSMFNGDNPTARSWLLALYRGIILLVVGFTANWVNEISKTITTIESSYGERLSEHDRRLDRHDGRITRLETERWQRSESDGGGR